MAVIFVTCITVLLATLRKQIGEEVKEFMPDEYHFISTWGPPLSRVQESKMKLQEALHEGDVLKIRPLTSQKRKAGNEDIDDVEPSSIPRTTPSAEILKAPPVKRRVQTTLTTLFGAKTSPTARYATASVRKGVHIYSEQDILRSSGTEKDQRKWWNEKAKELCEDPTNDILQGEAIDQKLHEEWRLYRAGKLVEEQVPIKDNIKEILEKYPCLNAFLASKNNIKEETLARNLKRHETAVSTVTRSGETLQEMSRRLHRTEKLGEKYQELQKKIEDHKETHRFHYRELCKAQDSLSKVLGSKKK